MSRGWSHRRSLTLARRAGLAALLVAGLCPIGAATAITASREATPNVRLLKHFPYTYEDYQLFAGATDIEFHGNYAYVTGGAGLHIYDVSSRVPKELSFLACSGTWPDIAFVRSGLVALAFFNNSRPCGPEHGIVLVDVSRPTRPLIVSSVDTPEGAHTITAHPSGRFIYASPGGLQPGPFVSIVDVSNAAKPRVVETFPAGQAGCHDISFSFTRSAKLGFCAAGVDRTTEIWDASDPMDPEPIGEIVNPAILFHHYAVATHDGRYLGLSDESVRCAPTQGSIWFYDITDPRDPKLMSWFDMPPDRYPADPVNGYCTAHNFNFVPDTYTMTLAWYNSGLNVIDFKDPSAPIEIAHYSTPNVNYWSAYFYKGRVFASDMDRGLDVFEIEGL